MHKHICSCHHQLPEGHATEALRYHIRHRFLIEGHIAQKPGHVEAQQRALMLKAAVQLRQSSAQGLLHRRSRTIPISQIHIHGNLVSKDHVFTRHQARAPELNRHFEADCISQKNRRTSIPHHGQHMRLTILRHANNVVPLKGQLQSPAAIHRQSPLQAKIRALAERQAPGPGHPPCFRDHVIAESLTQTGKTHISSAAVITPAVCTESLRVEGAQQDGNGSLRVGRQVNTGQNL